MIIVYSGMKPVNLNNVDYIDFLPLEEKKTAIIRFRFTGDYVDWKFNSNFEAAELVYESILSNFTEIKINNL
jgi:hypothetical protein